MATRLRQTLTELLVESKRLTQERLEEALARQRQSGEDLSKILVGAGWITPQDLMAVLSHELHLPAINLSHLHVDPAIVRLIPERLARQYHAVAIARLGTRLTVAMADPMNIFAIDDMASLTKFDIVPVVASDQDIITVLDATYRGGGHGEEAALEVEKPAASAEEGVVDLSKLGSDTRQAPIVKVVDAMIVEALNRRASDIHIEPEENDLRVRYRVDGDLQEAFTMAKRYQNALLARVKILSRLDITEWRLPQDGRFRVKFQNREVDFRVSILPINHGNKIVLRALDKQNLSIGLDALGFLPNSLKAFKDAAAHPYGMILVTGPTGSGKSTTLYSVLSQLNTIDRNVCTIEDPVEYQVEGITQIQANSDIGLTFAAGLRALLRQNPDVVMIGEIRDGETADIAIKSSLTGHLVLSTLHTNDAASSITRLVDMGVEPFLIASSLVLVAAQRLCRQLCAACRVPTTVSQEALERLAPLPETTQTPTWYSPGKGCQRCNKTGYRGRFAILETLMADNTIREMIAGRATSDEIKAYALSHGMQTLRQEGLIHAMAGKTSLEEVLRVTAEE